MLSVVFVNPELAARRLNISKSTLYSWLNGQTPNVATMLKIYQIYGINLTLDYMYNFFTMVKHLCVLNELDELTRYITISALDRDDKAFLMDYFKNKYWKHNG